MSKKADTGLSEPLLAPQKFIVVRLEILPFSSFWFLVFILPACLQKYMGCLNSQAPLYLSWAMWPVHSNCLVKHMHTAWYCGSSVLYRCVTCNFVISRLDKIRVACNGWVTLFIRGRARELWNNIRAGKTYRMTPLVFCFPALCQLVFNNLLLVCGVYFFFY